MEALLEIEPQTETSKFDHFLGLSIDMICIAGLDGYYKEVSSSFERVLGYSKEELLSRPYRDFVFVDDMEKVDDVIKTLRNGKPIFDFENRICCKNGDIKWFGWKSSRPTGETLVYAVARDITEQKMAQLKLCEYSEQLELFKEENLQSLRYAQKLQKAIMPRKESLQELFPESFIMFQPKHIVSGDFFWFDQTGDKILLSAGDCTGHGIPGALLSVLGINMLNNAFNVEGIHAPEKLLIKLDRALDELLKNKNEEKEMKDGMDLAICSIDKKNMFMDISSVNNSVYLLRENEIHVIKGLRYSMASNHSNVDFKTTRVSLQKNDIIYFFSDGYADQFGGIQGKKYGSKRLKEFLRSHGTFPLKEQKDLLEKNFRNWQGSSEQIDDVMVMGIKI
jgi:PAS domain S-box-containing protein